MGSLHFFSGKMFGSKTWIRMAVVVAMLGSD